MALQNTDFFLVNRAGTGHRLAWSELQSTTEGSLQVQDVFTYTGTTGATTAAQTDVPVIVDQGIRLPVAGTGDYNVDGAIRYSPSNSKLEMYYNGNWNTASGGTAFGATPPTPATEGDVWYDTDNGRSYVYYNDGTSSQWVEMNPAWDGGSPPDSVDTIQLVDESVTPAKLAAGGLIDFSSTGVGIGEAAGTSPLKIRRPNQSALGNLFKMSQATDDGSEEQTTTFRLKPQDGETRFEVQNTDVNLTPLLRFDVGINGAATITSDAGEPRVGIGTTAPQTSLHIHDLVPTISFQEGAGTSTISGDSGDLTYTTAGDADHSHIFLGGRMGIGQGAAAANTAMLSVAGDVNISAADNSRFVAPIASQGSSAANPGYTFAGQQTGMYLHTSNSLGFSTDATERLRIGSGGKVGINAANSTIRETLHVQDGNIIIGQESGNTTNIRNYVKFGRLSGPKAAIGFLNNAANGRGSLIFLNGSVSDGQEFTDSDEIMRLNTNGLAIGATGISSGDRLGLRGDEDPGRLTLAGPTNDQGDEHGAIRFRHSTLSGNICSKIASERTTGTSGGNLVFYTRTQADGVNTDGGVEKMRITNGGAEVTGSFSATGSISTTGGNMSLRGNSAQLIFKEDGSSNGDDSWTIVRDNDSMSLRWKNAGPYPWAATTSGGSVSQFKILSSAYLFDSTQAVFNAALKVEGHGLFVGDTDSSAGRTTISSLGAITSLKTYNTTSSNTTNYVRMTTAGLFQRSTSSRRYKDNIRDLDTAVGGLDVITKLTPRQWEDHANGEHCTGLIAEEVHEAGAHLGVAWEEWNSEIPQNGSNPVTKDGSEAKEGDLVVDGISDRGLIMHLVEAVKELKAENDALKARLDEAGL